MPKMKIERAQEKKVIYSNEHWNLLEKLRNRALKITSVFKKHGFETLTYGSISRGDVKPTSDIDIVLKMRLSSYRVELMLDEVKAQLLYKKIIQATPNDIVKVHYGLEGDICLTLLLTDFTTLPFEFYKFGGALTHDELLKGIQMRKPGVDKRLVLIQPTKMGHFENSLENMQYEASKIIGISQRMVDQRIRVLTRRDKVGRTGVFINQEMALSENVEDVLRELARKNSILRRRLNL